MIKLKELKAKLVELQAQIEAEEESRKQMFWTPKLGEEFFYIDSDLLINSRVYRVDNSEDCKSLIKANNTYELRSDAEAVASHLRGAGWFTRKAIQFSNGYVWTNGYDNCSVYLGRSGWDIAIDKHNNNGGVYMSWAQALQFAEYLNEYKPDGF